MLTQTQRLHLPLENVRVFPFCFVLFLEKMTQKVAKVNESQFIRQSKQRRSRGHWKPALDPQCSGAMYIHTCALVGANWQRVCGTLVLVHIQGNLQLRATAVAGLHL